MAKACSLPDCGQSLDLEQAARGFAAIGSEPRLAVLLTLVRAGAGGLSVGDIQARVDMPASTLTHHLKFLAAADLIEQRKKGRVILNRAAYDHLEALAGFLMDECCQDAPGGADRASQTNTAIGRTPPSVSLKFRAGASK